MNQYEECSKYIKRRIGALEDNAKALYKSDELVDNFIVEAWSTHGTAEMMLFLIHIDNDLSYCDKVNLTWEYDQLIESIECLIDEYIDYMENKNE